MKILYIFLIGAMLALVGCCDEKNSSSNTQNNDIKNSKTTSENTQKNPLPQDSTQNLDSASQPALVDFTSEFPNIFSSDTIITANHKPIVFIFGGNDCKGCELIKQSISNSPALQELLNVHFTTYYFNISVQKDYKFALDTLPLHLTTYQLQEKFQIQATPTLVFLDASGKQLFRYIGAMTKSQLNSTLNFLKDSRNQNLNEAQITQNLNNLYTEE